MNRSITAEIIGTPCDLGANIRGATMGPAAIRIAGLKDQIEALGCKVIDSGDISVPVRESLSADDRHKKYLGAIETICIDLEKRVHRSINEGRIPIMLGGDHSFAIGSISGACRALKEQKKNLGLLWIDAHADLNTPETSPSGNIHGMPLAALLGLGHPALTSVGGSYAKVDAQKVALIGIRDIDNNEKKILKDCGIRFYTMREIDERGKYAVMKEALDIVSNGTDGIHLSCDLDGVDPQFAPGVSTPVPGGLSFREIHLALEMLADSGKLCSMDIVELNPIRDRHSQTAQLAVGLVLSALGKSIV